MANDDLATIAADPTTTLAELARLAQQHPELRVIIAENPAAYDQLIDWLDQQDDPLVRAAIARRRGRAVADQPAVPDGALHRFAGNGTAGSVRLTIFPTYLEYEHRNYFVSIPLDRVGKVSYSKDGPGNKVVDIDEILFGCDNAAEVYAAVRDVMAGLR